MNLNGYLHVALHTNVASIVVIDQRNPAKNEIYEVIDKMFKK